ncbi:hypothetical protein PHYSODRAFT_335469 [Phytophthora sojae]|uniref:Uncharacterized protein n=1 Tax=Phytophthora sojae (strain P6497) TaxID=1094619 RepID=G4ZVA6_PHYSP|nr:hypothetical protein PHYSODRAFT_335469 [Phytophthora sojae]EGZ13730.1 hypothetical protein PHYSODRAFT_335469 [Phytophthora sojae]|eukprot:XP_009531159.1 hypothetical protein PHYSODRAFT_335469 [Phytophthora sojae]
MLISAYLIFPIPFSVLTMTPIYNIIYLISLRIVVGAEAIERTKAQPEQFKRFLNNLHAQVAMMFVYPIYEVLFRTAEGSHYQLLVILLLPVIRVFLKNIVRKSMMHAEDMVPEAVIFTVDFFNAIYTATCMQTASSVLSISMITVTDLSQTAAMFSHTNTIDHPTFLRDSLEVLFTVECLVVTAYLEAVIPLFYTAYILVMVHLPSSRYHTEMVGMTPDNVVARILPVFTFGLLEIAPLVLLVVVIKRNCRMRAIYHLAFVLESQRSLIQIKLIVWVMITLCFRVMHFAYLIFPLPFSILTMTPIYNILHIVLFRVIMGGNAVQKLLTRREQLVKYMNFLYAQILMMFVYPVYELLFRLAEGSKYQFLVIPLLPVIKVGIKNIVLRCVAHVEDIAPESVIFTVDYFNAIYVATCMQSAFSVLAIVAISVTDLSQTVIMLYGLHHRTISIRKMLRHYTDCGNPGDMLGIICSLCQNPDKFKKIASFWVLVIMVKRSCGMNALYHLAFVLKAQRPLIQGKLMIWMVVFPCADFTFNFARLGYNF